MGAIDLEVDVLGDLDLGAHDLVANGLEAIDP